MNYPYPNNTRFLAPLSVVFLAMLLTACGGGGGGSAALTPPALVLPPTAEEDAARMAAAEAARIAAVEAARRRLYTTGTTDKYFMAGCTPVAECYSDGVRAVDVRDSTGSVYPNGVTVGHRRIEGPVAFDPRLAVPQPPLDVRQAWRDGWTGQGVNVLIMDAFGTPNRPIISSSDNRGTHGYTVGMSAAGVAQSANYSGLESGLSRQGTHYRQGGVLHGGTRTTTFQVINLSFGHAERTALSRFGTQLSRSEFNAALTNQQNTPYFLDLLGTGGYLTGTADAVITKAAGNNNGDHAAFYIDNDALVLHHGTGPRTLIVGALDKYARTRNPQKQSNISTRARMASYSNIAGTYLPIQNRFLVEYGGTPYGGRAYLCDAAVSNGCHNLQVLDDKRYRIPEGTSFAAPRVAGFAALVRDKFPNVSGAQTATILLDTATTAGLACHAGTARKSTGCVKNIYGQGRVDIGNALAPVGAVR